MRKELAEHWSNFSWVLSVEANLDGSPVGVNANLQKLMTALRLEGLEMQSGNQELW